MIQSTKDEYVSEADYKRFLATARDPKKLVLIDASNHRFTDRRDQLRTACFAGLAVDRLARRPEEPDDARRGLFPAHSPPWSGPLGTRCGCGRSCSSQWSSCCRGTRCGRSTRTMSARRLHGLDARLGHARVRGRRVPNIAVMGLYDVLAFRHTRTRRSSAGDTAPSPSAGATS